jgi:hypothetical protein
MSLKINSGSLMASRYLTVEKKGIVFCNTDLFGTKKFRFEQIDFIYLSPKNILSFQVDKEVFSLPIQPEKKPHQEGLNAFLLAVRQARAEAAIPPIVSENSSIPGPSIDATGA